MKAAVLLVLAGCADSAHVSLRNAPGSIDLATPIAHENGDPARYEPPKDPGADTTVLFAIPYVVGGAGRFRPGSDGSGELGFEMRAEQSRHGLLDPEAWAITAGMAFVQWGDAVRTVAPGAFYAEVDRRWLAKVWPIDVGVGPLLYVDDSSVGVQATLRVAVVMIRARYVANTGAEWFVGGEIPIPFFFGQSR